MASGEGDFYEIVRADNASAESSIEDLHPHVPDPIAVKGSGHITMSVFTTWNIVRLSDK